MARRKPTPEELAALGVESPPSPPTAPTRRRATPEELALLSAPALSQTSSDEDASGGPVVGRVRATLGGLTRSMGLKPETILSGIEAPGRALLEWQSPSKVFQEGKDFYRPAYDAAAKAYPAEASLGGLLPALAAPAKIPVQAGLGAVRGYATSPAETIGGKLRDAVTDAGLSAAGTGAGKVLVKAMNAVGRGVAPKLGQYATPAISAYLGWQSGDSLPDKASKAIMSAYAGHSLAERGPAALKLLMSPVVRAGALRMATPMADAVRGTTMGLGKASGALAADALFPEEDEEMLRQRAISEALRVR